MAGTGVTYRRGKTWWIPYSVNGKQYHESAETTRKPDADAFLRKRLQAIGSGTFFPGERKAVALTMGALRDCG